MKKYIFISTMFLVMLLLKTTIFAVDTIEIKYEYNEETNEVIAKIISSAELKDTKPTWNLNEDKKEYTKLFTENTNYTTKVEDKDGNITEVEINVTQIQKAEIQMTYEYNEETNEVTAIMTSNIELQDTKPTWELSEDKKVYKKTFIANTNYSTAAIDKFGNIIDVPIEITQIKIANIEVKYEYDEIENIVTAYIISDRELQDTKPTWELSENKKVYTKIFTANTNYNTLVIDKAENIIDVPVEITQVIVANIEVQYEYNELTNTVTAQMISDRELQHTKPTWELSENKKIYTKIFTTNENYSTLVTDKGGNIINVNILINQIDNKAPEITYEYQYNDNQTVVIYLKSNERMGNTKPTWNLSSDGLTYSKIFDANQNYTTKIQDIYGNEVTIPIKLKKKQEEISRVDGNKIKIRYMYTSYDNVIVQIVSSVRLADTKPTWELSADGYTYTKVFTQNEDYTTLIQDIYGTQNSVRIEINYYLSIAIESGSYGISGAKVRGVNGGSNLEYLRFGNGENVLFATFCLHGYEDLWDRDGGVLVDIANDFYNRLVSEYDQDLAKDWTIYIFREVNPDGRRLGYTKDGPGRTTLYSTASKGIDLNRCWQTGSSYKRYTSNRNYNGIKGFQAYEAAYLKEFLLSHKSQYGKTILVDLHGWLDQLIGDEEICKYYNEQYHAKTLSYGRYGTQYLIAWARQNLGAKVALVELPEVANYEQVNSMRLSDKYIKATLNMLRTM